jgi:hypothetical protein
MTSRNLPNVNIEVPDQQVTKLRTNREMVSSARRNNRPLSSNSNQLPIKHEPCSSTLGKFHDAVNFSLVLDHHNTTATSRKEEPAHPIMAAKNKYKYMVRQKSFIDESLFGNTSARQRPPISNRYGLGDHLSHDLMSNLAPLIVNPPIRSINSARSDTSNNLSLKPRNNEDKITKLDKTITSKPWRP